MTSYFLADKICYQAIKRYLLKFVHVSEPSFNKGIYTPGSRTKSIHNSLFQMLSTFHNSI